MDNKTSKPTTAIYSFRTDEGTMADIDLKGYRAICTVTKQPKQFHHTYLARMIAHKYNGNWDTFVATYVSREGLAQRNKGKRVEQIKNKIDQNLSRSRRRSRLLMLISKLILRSRSIGQDRDQNF